MKNSSQKQHITYFFMVLGELELSLLGIISFSLEKIELAKVSFALLALFSASSFLFLKNKEN